jgi:LacI family transcriptional regulator
MTALSSTMTPSLTLPLSFVFFRRASLQFTMRDVAKEAEVSIKTVSRVVNDQGEITEETRKKVLKAIEKLGYRPSKVARALVTRRTDTIGLLIGDIANPYFSEVARGVLDVAREQEYDVFLCNTDGTPVTEKRALFSLIDHNVDGAIIYPTYENLSWLEEFGSPVRPLVLVNTLINSIPGVGIVRTRITEGAELAVSYLIEKGHREIGMIAGEVAPLNLISRVNGYRQALERHSFSFREDMVEVGPPVIEHGYEATKILIERNPNLTAIFCYNDLLAMGAAQSCKMMGLRVPEDCAIIGFDNIRFSEMIDPPLTTIHVDKYEIGKRSASLLLDMLDDPEGEYPPLYVDTKLILRESA